MIKVLLIDDEKTALEQLKYVLSQYQEIDILAAFLDPVEALREIDKTRPDVVFLDIEMPEINGLIVAEEILNIDENIAIVFVTGYDEYAIKAFEVNAVDYILKPISKKRINQTIQKLIKKVDKGKEIDQQKARIFNVNKLLGQSVKKIFVWENEKITLLNPTVVILFTLEGRDVIVVTKQQQYKTSQTLNYWEERLMEFNFFRCHRSFLINLEKIEKILPMFNNTYYLKLRDYPHEVPVSRNSTKQLKQILGLI